jgi:hypothetical protein
VLQGYWDSPKKPLYAEHPTDTRWEPCFFWMCAKQNFAERLTQAYADCTGRLRGAWFQEFHWAGAGEQKSGSDDEMAKLTHICLGWRMSWWEGYSELVKVCKPTYNWGASPSLYKRIMVFINRHRNSISAPGNLVLCLPSRQAHFCGNSNGESKHLRVYPYESVWVCLSDNPQSGKMAQEWTGS